MAEEIVLSQGFLKYNSMDDFPEEERNLLTHAIESSKMAYAPYSNFHVGAVVLLDDKTIVAGANQENAAFPSGSCAERVAFGKAATTGKKQKILLAAVVALKNGQIVPASPCGGCRQLMLEAEAIQKDPIQLIMMTEEGEWIKTKNIKSLLPFSFKL